MSRKHSYKITISNNKTEKEGINYLLENHSGFFLIDLVAKREILRLLNLDARFLRSFDLIYIHKLLEKPTANDYIEIYIEDIILVELKTTKKYLPQNPKGFFFGATENEFKLAELVGDKFKFCFVCLNKASKSCAMLTLEELEKIIRNKRIQFQINL